MDSATRYAREHPVNPCDYTHCAINNSQSQNVPASSDTGGQTGDPGGLDPNDPNKLPAKQRVIRDTLLEEHPGLNSKVATDAARGGSYALGKGGEGADVALPNGGGREVSVHSGAFSSQSIGTHLVNEASQRGTTEIYFQINSANATRQGLLEMMSGLRNGYTSLDGIYVKIFGSDGEVWWNGVFRAPKGV